MSFISEDLTVLVGDNTPKQGVIDALVLAGWSYAGEMPRTRYMSVTALKFFRVTRQQSDDKAR